MGVAHQRCSDDVLVTLHEDGVADSELIGEILRLLVTNDVRNAIVCFNLSQGSLKPLDVLGRVVLVGWHVPVIGI